MSLYWPRLSLDTTCTKANQTWYERIYTIQTMKVLFPQIQCKCSFRKCVAATIKTWLAVQQKTSIIFLTTLWLRKNCQFRPQSLFFVSTPNQTFERKITKSWRNFKTHMSKHCRQNSRKTTSFKKKTELDIPPLWQPHFSWSFIVIGIVLCSSGSANRFKIMMKYPN